MQLQVLGLSSNHLVGSLPETWSNLTNVSPDSVINLQSVHVLSVCSEVRFRTHNMLDNGSVSMFHPDTAARVAMVLNSVSEPVLSWSLVSSSDILDTYVAGLRYFALGWSFPDG